MSEAKRMDDLAQKALDARAHAYAPYSGYSVGCALVADGKTYAGANLENASYGLAICAERSAVAHAIFDGAKNIEAVAVATTSSPPAAPCGMCLQTLFEFADAPERVQVILVNPKGERRQVSLADCLPYGFRKQELGK